MQNTPSVCSAPSDSSTGLTGSYQNARIFQKMHRKKPGKVILKRKDASTVKERTSNNDVVHKRQTRAKKLDFSFLNRYGRAAPIDHKELKHPSAFVARSEGNKRTLKEVRKFCEKQSTISPPLCYGLSQSQIEEVASQFPSQYGLNLSSNPPFNHSDVNVLNFQSDVACKPKMYTESEVLLMLKAMIKELADIVCKSGFMAAAPFRPLNSMANLNFSSLLSLNLLPNQNLSGHFGVMNTSLQNIMNSHDVATKLGQSLWGQNMAKSTLNNILKPQGIFSSVNQGNSAINSSFSLVKKSQPCSDSPNFESDNSVDLSYAGLIKLRKCMTADTIVESDTYQSSGVKPTF